MICYIYPVQDKAPQTKLLFSVKFYQNALYQFILL